MKVNEPKLRRDIRDDRAKAQLQTMGEDLIQAIIGSPLKPHEKRSLLHDVIDGCKEANRNDIPGWRSTMKITESQLRKDVRKLIREQMTEKEAKSGWENAVQRWQIADQALDTDIEGAEREQAWVDEVQAGNDIDFYRDEWTRALNKG